MAFADQFMLAADATFRGKVRIAICKSALAVAGEAPSNSYAQDVKRQALANKVLADGGEVMLDAFAYALASLGTLTTSSTDSDVEFTVNSVWSDIAGVSGRELG